jgi:hypothetical protein
VIQVTDWIDLDRGRSQWPVLLNKSSGSIRGRKFLSERVLVSQERLCFVELVRRYAISTYRYTLIEHVLFVSKFFYSAAKIIKGREERLMNSEEEGWNEV